MLRAVALLGATCCVLLQHAVPMCRRQSFHTSCSALKGSGGSPAASAVRPCHDLASASKCLLSAEEQRPTTTAVSMYRQAQSPLYAGPCIKL